MPLQDCGSKAAPCAASLQKASQHAVCAAHAEHAAHAVRMHPMQDALESIVDMREHDVPYHVRFEIDTDVRCGHWFTVRAKVGGVLGPGGTEPGLAFGACNAAGTELRLEQGIGSPLDFQAQFRLCLRSCAACASKQGARAFRQLQPQPTRLTPPEPPCVAGRPGVPGAAARPAAARRAAHLRLRYRDHQAAAAVPQRRVRPGAARGVMPE